MKLVPANPTAGCLFAACLAFAVAPTPAQELGQPSTAAPAVFVDPRAPDTIAPVGYAAPLPVAESPPAADRSGSPIPPDRLPNTAGQIWRTYDVRSYTQQIGTTNHPQQAMIDWILKETGTELWFNEPLGVLSASRDQLIVYHTPEIQAVVERVVDRFLHSGGQRQILGIRLMTVGSPTWRSGAYALLQPIDVVSPGVEGWMLSKENAAVLIHQLRRRTDYTDHGSGDLTAHAGQRMVLSQTRPIDFTSAVRWVPGRFPPYESVAERIDEGYTLDLSALAGSDGSLEAIVRCSVDQVERLQPVEVDVPNNSGGFDTVRIAVPQTLSWRLHERFRWPADQVLLLSCGVVANPSDAPAAGLGLQSLFGRTAGRADALLLIEFKGVARTEAPPAIERSALAPVETVR